MPTVTATAARSTPPLDLNIPRTDAPQRQRCHDRDEAERSAAPAPRRNPLVAAMMQALGSLMPSSKTTTAQDTKTAATDSSATAAAATPDASSSLKDAAMAFAHELFNALRSTGSGRDGGDSASESGRVHGHGHHHHGHGRGYGDLAQRLERLASEVAAPAKPAEPAQPDGAALSITASLTTASFSTTQRRRRRQQHTTSVNLTHGEPQPHAAGRPGRRREGVAAAVGLPQAVRCAAARNGQRRRQARCRQRPVELPAPARAVAAQRPG